MLKYGEAGLKEASSSTYGQRLRELQGFGAIEPSKREEFGALSGCKVNQIDLVAIRSNLERADKF